MTRPLPTRKPNGFTLLELAIVLVIIGLVGGGGLLVVNSMVSHHKRSQALQQLEDARRALLTYASYYKSLPYADSGDDGVADAGATEGWLPYKTLLIKPYDAWGRKIKYEINGALSCSTLKGIINGSADLSAWRPKVWDADGAAASNPFATMVILVSAGAADADHSGNVFDAIYDGSVTPAVGGSNVSGSPYLRQKPTSEFDDLVLYVGAPTLYDWMKCK